MVALFAAARPPLLVLGYVCTRPLVDLAVYRPIGGVTLGQAWGAGLLAILGWYWIRSLPKRPSVSELLVPVSTLLVYSAVVLSRGDVMLGLNGLLKFSAWALLIPTVASIVREEGEDLPLRLASVGAAASVVTMAVVIVTDRYGAAYYRGADIGWVQGPHGIASTAVMWVPLLLRQAQRKARPAASIALVSLLGVGVLLSLVRTALLGFVTIVGAHVALSGESRSRGARVAAAVAAAFVLLVAVAAQPLLTARLADLENLKAGGSAVLWAGGGRVGIWAGALDRAFQDWSTALLGQGSGVSFEVARFSMGSSVWSHNDFVEMLLTGGLILLAVYCLFLVWIARPFVRRAALRGPDAAPGVVGVAAWAAFVIMAFFNGMIWYQASVVAALAFGCLRAVVESMPTSSTG